MKYADIVGNQEGINDIQKKFAIKNKKRELEAHIDANEQKIEELKMEISIMKRTYDLDFQLLTSKKLDLKAYREALELLKEELVEMF